MYKVVKTEMTNKRPKWLVSLLIRCKPMLIGTSLSLSCCQVVIRYLRFCAYLLFKNRTTDKVYIQQTEHELVLYNNRRKPCISFKIVECNDDAR